MLFLLALCLSAIAGDLQVHVLDVGQGDAILLEASNGKRVLVDAGTKGSGVTQQLQARGIKTLDLVVATHAHADHIGGMAEVLSTFQPKLYVDNSMPHSTLTYSRTMSAVERHELGYRAAALGRVFNVDKDVKLTILHPGTRLLRGTRSDLNSNSVIIRVDHGKDCILLTGDAEDPTERALMQRNIQPCQVLKVAHHGSEHSTSSAWLRAVQPEIALISVGGGNRYGHPAPETIERLKSAQTKIHRTDLEGTLTVISTGKGVRIKTARSAPKDAESPSPSLARGSAHDRHEPTPTHPPAAPSPAPAADAIDINQADAVALDTLPGIGPARAAAILSDRASNGPFASCEDLQRVHGIGPKTVAGLSERCIAPAPKDKE